MDFKVFSSDQALSDLSEIVEYVARDNPQVASRLGRSLIDHLKVPQAFPYVGELVPKRAGVRKLFHTPYKIYYRIHADRKVVEILHFWHAAPEQPTI